MTTEWLTALNLVLLFGLKVTAFSLAYLVVKLGFRLLEAGVKGEFKFKASLAGLRADLASVSPGLLFVLLGVVLLGYAIYVPKVVELDALPPVHHSAPPTVHIPPVDTSPTTSPETK